MNLRDKLNTRIYRIEIELPGDLTDAEWERLRPKLELTQRIAQHSADGMVKGTRKYPTDHHSVDTWLEMGMDDAVDAVNYIALLTEAIWRERRDRSAWPGRSGRRAGSDRSTR